MAAAVLLAFGAVSSAVLIAFGLRRALARSYRDRTGVVREGAAAVRAGLLVAVIGLGELLLTLFLYLSAR